MRRQDVLIALPFIFLLAVPFVSDAQLIRGVVSGTVTDAGNAVISGVQVTLTNTSTNISRQTVTNDLGIYRFVAVEPGEYSAEFIFFRLRDGQDRQPDHSDCPGGRPRRDAPCWSGA
jgi:hypothetical protein